MCGVVTHGAILNNPASFASTHMRQIHITACADSRRDQLFHLSRPKNKLGNQALQPRLTLFCQTQNKINHFFSLRITHGGIGGHRHCSPDTRSPFSDFRIQMRRCLRVALVHSGHLHQGWPDFSGRYRMTRIAGVLYCDRWHAFSPGSSIIIELRDGFRGLLAVVAGNQYAYAQRHQCDVIFFHNSSNFLLISVPLMIKPTMNAGFIIKLTVYSPVMSSTISLMSASYLLPAYQ